MFTNVLSLVTIYGLIHEVIYLVITSLPPWLFLQSVYIPANLSEVKTHPSAGALYALTLRLKPSVRVQANFFFFLMCCILPCSGNPVKKKSYVLGVLSFFGT
jgi:hypothetical protein